MNFISQILISRSYQSLDSKNFLSTQPINHHQSLNLSLSLKPQSQSFHNLKKKKLKKKNQKKNQQVDVIFLETQSFVFEHVMNLIHTPIARTPMISWVVSGSCQVIMIHPASRIVKVISIYPSERIRSQVGRVRLFKVQPPPHLQSPHLLRLSVSPPSHPPLQV